MKFIDEIKRKFSATVHIRCEAEVNEKIERLVLDGPDKLQIISNFERIISKPIICPENKNKFKMSTFSVFHKCESLPEYYIKKSHALSRKYYPIEYDSQMTAEQKIEKLQKITEEWYSQGENLLKGVHFYYEDIEKSIKKANVKLRDGSAEAFNKLCVQNIPLIVMSVGMGDVVGLTLKLENLLTDNISVVSNFLKVTKDSSGVSTIHGYKGNKLVHAFNKNHHAYIYLRKNDTHLSGRFNVILLGDTLLDANMDGGIPFNTVLRIGFFNRELREHGNGLLQEYKLAFDIVLVQDQTMGLLNYLLEEIIGETSTII